MTKTILLADDSVTIQKVIELTFMDQDHQVVSVGGGEEALAKLDEIKPDFIIADVHMPGPSGFEVCRRAKEKIPGVPVLLLVGTFEPFDEAEFQACGADRYLKKPFDSQELLRHVEELSSASAPPPSTEATAAAESLPDLEPPPPLEGAEDSSGVGSFRLDMGSLEDEPPSERAASGEPPAAGPASDGGDVVSVEPEPTGSETVLLSMPDIAPPGTGPDAEAPEPAPASPEPAAEPAAAQVEAAADPPASPAAGLSDEDVERIARRLAELVSEKLVRDVAWEVIPDLAEVVIKERIQELESQVE